MNANGLVTIKGPGEAVITVSAAENNSYYAAQKQITVKVSLAKPSLTAVNKKGKMVKLTWSKVQAADGYKIYIKGPKDKKYRLRLTKKANVKSVTHRGLKLKKTYRYKVVAYKVVNGKTVYGPYSSIKKIKVKK